MIVSVVAISLACFVATMVGTFTDAEFGEGIWPAVFILPGIGLPIAFVLIIVLLVVSIVRRRREAGDAER